jgi:hypothetical protein
MGFILVSIIWLIQISIVVFSLFIGWKIMTATERIADAIESQQRKEGK